MTGKGKSPDLVSDGPGYAVLPFLADEMIAAYAAADIVVSRAGMGAISELAALQKIRRPRASAEFPLKYKMHAN